MRTSILLCSLWGGRLGGPPAFNRRNEVNGMGTTDADRQRANALARWEGEGGGLGSRDTDPALDDADLRILGRLGAALLETWDDCPQALQRTILHRAPTLNAATDAGWIKSAIARVLVSVGS